MVDGEKVSVRLSIDMLTTPSKITVAPRAVEEHAVNVSSKSLSAETGAEG